jgi:hypothetical protein
MSAQIDLNTTLAGWSQLTHDYRKAAPDAAAAEARYRSTRSREIRTLLIEDPKMAIGRAEYLADGSPEVEKMLLDRLVADAQIDAMKQRLKWFEAETDRLRSLVVTERAQDSLHSTYGQG